MLGPLVTALIPVQVIKVNTLGVAQSYGLVILSTEYKAK
jgi:hypothetical protein